MEERDIRMDYMEDLGNFLYYSGFEVIYPGGEQLRKDEQGREYLFMVFRLPNTVGSIRIYGYESILVAWITEVDTLPSTGVEVFHSSEDMKVFLRQSFIDFDEEV